MKQILPLLFLFFGLSRPVFAAIDFQISNFEKVNEYYSVEAEITGAATGSAYFVQAMFTKPDENSYFGYTWSQKGEWFKYLSSPDKEFIKSDFPILPSGQKLKFLLKPDSESTKYTGPGSYVLKLKRYTGESSSGYYSNALTISLSENTPAPIDTPTPTTTAAPTGQPTNSPTSTPVSTTTPTPTRTPTSTPTTVQARTPTPTLKLSMTSSPTMETIASVASNILLTEQSSNSSEILGDSIETVSPTKSKEENIYSRNETAIYKYTFVIGAVISAISGTWLYLRHKTD